MSRSHSIRMATPNLSPFGQAFWVEQLGAAACVLADLANGVCV